MNLQPARRDRLWGALVLLFLNLPVFARATTCEDSLDIPVEDFIGAEREWKVLFSQLPDPFQRVIRNVDFDSGLKDHLMMVLILDREALAREQVVIQTGAVDRPVVNGNQLLLPEWFFDHLVFTREE